MKRKAKRIVNNPVLSLGNGVKKSVLNHDGFGTSMPPSLQSVEIYFDQKGVIEVSLVFHAEHELREWKSATGQPIINWKVCAADWIYDYRQAVKIRLRKSPFYSESS